MLRLRTWQVGGDGGDTHDGTFGRSVAPRFVVAGEDAQVTASHEVFVVETEQRVGWRQEFRMEDHLI